MAKREYIRFDEMRCLLSLVPELENKILSLKAELKRLEEFEKDNNNNDYIESAMFGNVRLSDMPCANTNKTPDKTADIAVSHEQQMSHEAKEIKRAKKDIVREIYNIETILDKVRIGLNSLGKIQREILQFKYWENKTWDEIIEYLKTKNIFYSKKHIRYKAKNSINKLNSVAMIDIKIYQNVINVQNN